MSVRKRTAELLEQGHYNDRASRMLNLALVTLILLNVLSITLESVESLLNEYRTYFWYFELFSVVVFTIEYLARVWSSIDLDEIDNRSPVLGRIKFMLQPLSLVDLVAIVPFYLGLYFSLDLRFLRILRMLRLFKLARYSPALNVLLDVLQKEAKTLSAAFVVLLIMLVLSASGIYFIEHKAQPEAFGSIPKAMWWAMITLTTVGYGDVVPITAAGKLFATFIGLIGIGMVAIPAAIMASGFAENLHERREIYNALIRRTLRDGLIREHERHQLEDLRKELGLTSTEALRMLDSIVTQAGRHRHATCPHCGKKLNDKPEAHELGIPEHIEEIDGPGDDGRKTD